MEAGPRPQPVLPPRGLSAETSRRRRGRDADIPRRRRRRGRATWPFRGEPPRPRRGHFRGDGVATRTFGRGRRARLRYTYFRPGAILSLRKGAIEGRDYFATEADVAKFVKSRRINGLEGRRGAVGEDTRRRAAEDDARLEALRARELALQKTYRLVLGGRFASWPVRAATDDAARVVATLREGDGVVAPGDERDRPPPGGWVSVVAVVRAFGRRADVALCAAPSICGASVRMRGPSKRWRHCTQRGADTQPRRRRDSSPRNVAATRLRGRSTSRPRRRRDVS